MMPLQGIHPLESIVPAPLLRRPVRPRHPQPVPHRRKDRSLDREFIPPAGQQVLQDRRQTQLLPPTAEHPRRSDLDRLSGGQGLTRRGIEHADLLSEPGAGTDPSIELALGRKHIQPAQRGDDWLADSAVDALVLDDWQVLIEAGRLGSDKRRPLLPLLPERA